ncbi:hypothetical protein [Streptomyces rimosus]|uniref:hypothetical protein n=1 Tax=Streptomyces rimosus TaxID=1927 RepID=UPI000A4B9897|nr:hypothetical protein [Streptomyces rimosus]
MASETRVPSQAAPAADLPKCSDVGDPNGGNAFAGRSFGVPASVVTLGADWTTYTAILTNASAKEMKSFELSGKALSYVYNEGERDLSPYSDLQYWGTTQHAWNTLKDANGKARTIPIPKTLKLRESVHVKLRFRVHKDLPMDHAYDAFTGITGSFVSRHNGTDCTVNGDADGSFSPPRGLRPAGRAAAETARQWQFSKTSAVVKTFTLTTPEVFVFHRQ